MHANERRHTPRGLLGVRGLSSIIGTRQLRSVIVTVTWVVCGWVAVVFGPGHERLVVGQEPGVAVSGSVEEGDLPVKFRRIYALWSAFESWPTGGLDYRPVNRELFDAMIARINAAASGQTGLLAASITSASYDAVLREDGLLSGHAVLAIRHAGEEAATLGLDPCGLSLRDLRWSGPEPREAVHGLSADGQYDLIVDRAGTLEFDWTLQGTHDVIGSLEFDLRLPRSPAAVLHVDLPTGMTPQLEPSGPVEVTSESDSRGTWRLQLGGRNESVLSITSSEGSQRANRKPRVRQRIVYDLSLGGLEVESFLSLDVLGEPLREITLELDPGVKLVRAAFGETPVYWSVAPGTDSTESSRVTLRLPKAIQGSERELYLLGRGPVRFDALWELPGVRPDRTTLAWQEATATVQVTRPVMLDRLEPKLGRQLDTRVLTGETPGESARVQFFSADAGIEVLLSHDKPAVEIDSGCLVELRSGDMSANLTASLRISDGEQFSWTAKVSPEWVLDSVTSVPVDALSGWRLDENGQRLEVRLEQALTPERPIRLRILGHRLHQALQHEMSYPELMPLVFDSESEGRRLLAIHASDQSYQLEVSGTDRMEQLDPQENSLALRDLFAPLPTGLVLDVVEGASDLRVSLGQHLASYSADISVEADVRETGLIESYFVRCIPEGTDLDRLVVHFAFPSVGPPRWTLPGTSDRVARLTPNTSARGEGAGDSEGETWEISLDPPQSVPFVLGASRERALDAALAVNLLALPEATSQKAMLTIRVRDPASVHVENGRLKQVPMSPVPVDQFSTIHSTYRYDPLHDLADTLRPAVLLAPVPEQAATPGACVWNCRIDSRHEADGTVTYSVRYDIENSGRDRVELELPASVTVDTLQGPWIDGVRVTKHAVHGRRIVVELPGTPTRFPVLSFQYSESGRRLGMLATISPTLPKIDLPVYAYQWTAWLPPEYEALSSHEPGLHSWRQAIEDYAKRLAGPLLGGAHEEPFDPISPRDWSGALRQTSLRSRSHAKAVGYLERLADVDRGTWGELFGDHETNQWLRSAADGLPTMELLIDAEAMAVLEIAPGGTPPSLRAISGGGSSFSLLQQSGLAILVDEQTVVVTSSRQSASLRGRLASIRGDGIWWIADPSLRQEVNASRRSMGSRYVSPADWSQRAPLARLPWKESRQAGYTAGDFLGWAAWEADGYPQSRSELRVAHHDTLHGLRWIAMMSIVVLAFCLRRMSATGLLLLAGGFAVALLFVEEPYVTILSGCFLGAVCSLAFRAIRGRRCYVADVRVPSSGPGSRVISPTVVPRIGLLILITAALFTLCVSAGGQEAEMPAQVASESAGGSHRVFIPVDERGVPVGSDCYVPGTLYHGELLPRDEALTNRSRGWLLRDAMYRGVLDWQVAPDMLVVSELTAALDIEVLGSSARVRIPLAGVLSDTVRLDGRPVQPEVLEEDGSLTVRIAGTGAHELVMELQPLPWVEGTQSGFDLSIPRLPTSRLELEIPPDTPTIQVARAVGRVLREEDPPRLTADLGPISQLRVLWLEGVERGAPDSEVEVEELVWIKVDPGSVSFDARFKYHVTGSPIEELLLDVDPRLRRSFPFNCDVTTISPQSSIPGQSETVRLKLGEPVADQMTLEAKYSLRGSSGIGSLPLPRLEARNARVTKRYLAVSVDETLESVAPTGTENGPDVIQIGGPQFVEQWGVTSEQPLYAYELMSSDSEWDLAIQPKAPHTVVLEQTVVYHALPDKARISYEAALETTGFRFQYRLTAPTAFRVRNVSVIADGDGDELVRRWASAKDGTIDVFLKDRVAGVHTLSLEGEVPQVAGKETLLPDLHVQDADVSASEILLLRDPAVFVETTVGAGIEPIESTLPSRYRDDGRTRLVSHWRREGASGELPSIRVSPNRPEFRVNQTTSMASETRNWVASSKFQVTVSRGVVDEFRLSIPPQWQGLTEVAPASLEVLESSDQTLLLRPRLPVERGDTYEFTVSCPLATEETVAVPDIVLEGAATARRIIILPTMAQLQPAVWETQSLKSIAVPKELTPSFVSGDELVAYRVEKGPFQAILQSRTGEPVVSMADIALSWTADGTCHGVAAFDLDSARLSDVILHIPRPYRLIRLMVDGIAVAPTPVSERRMRVTLGSVASPQRVEVLFQGDLPSTEAQGRRVLDVPTLEGIQVRETIWTVSAPRPYRQVDGVGQEAVTSVTQDLARLRSLTALMQVAVEGVGEERPDLSNWYERWAGRWCELWHALSRQASILPTASDLEGKLESFKVRQEAIAADLQCERILQERMGTIAAASRPHRLWWRMLPATNTIVRTQSPGGPTPLALEYQEPGLSLLQFRAMVTGAIVVLTLFLMIGSRNGLFLKLFRRWPYLTGIVLGISWWLWCRPSLLGLVIVGISLIPVFRSGWKRTRESVSLFSMKAPER